MKSVSLKVLKNRLIEYVRMASEGVRKGWIRPPVIVAKDPPSGVPVSNLKVVLEGLTEDRSER